MTPFSFEEDDSEQAHGHIKTEAGSICGNYAFDLCFLALDPGPMQRKSKATCTESIPMVASYLADYRPMIQPTVAHTIPGLSV
jgi:hypothetical protein